MSSIVAVTAKLDEQAIELDTLSKALAETERKLEPLEKFYEEAVDDFETSCWDAHVKEDAKLPPSELRERLARRTIPEQVLNERAGLLAKRKRLEKRIRHLGDAIDAQRSIVAALRSEMEATR